MHLHFEVPLSSVRLSVSEEAGDVADSYGMSSAMCRHRLPSSFPSPLATFFAPNRSVPRPSARRAAPSRQPRDDGQVPATAA